MQLYKFVLLTGALVSLLIAAMAWRRRAAPGALPLMVMQLSVAWWQICHALPPVLMGHGEGLLVQARLISLGIVFIPPMTLLFVSGYARGTRHLRLSTLAALAVEPVIMLVAMHIPSLQNWFFGTWHGLPADGNSNLGPLFWVHALYCYVLIGKSLLILVAAYEQDNAITRRQTRYILLAVLLPVFFNLAFVSGLLPSYADLTPLGFVISGVLYAIAIVERGLFDFVQVAQAKAKSVLTDGFLLIDAQRRIVDSNESIMQMFSLDQPAKAGQPLGRQLPELDERCLSVTTGHAIFEFMRGPDQFLELRAFAICDDRGELSGHVLMVRDISTATLAAAALEQSNRQLRMQLETIEGLQAQLREQVVRDPLTGLYNRRYLLEALRRELEHGSRYDTPFAVVMIDVDSFKSVNDVYGHACGDAMLQGLGALLIDQSRPTDSPCRYGGEEFIVVMSGASLDVAIKRADEWRTAFSRLRFPFNGVEVGRTFSAGIAVFPQDGSDETALLAAADNALYRAKAIGRNVICSSLCNAKATPTDGVEETGFSA